MKKCIIIMLIMLLIMSMNVIIYAANENVTAILNKEVSIVYNDEIKSFSDVNGKVVYPLSFEGTTYLPVRAISSMFDIPVLWDGGNNKIYLDSGDLVASTVTSVLEFKKGVSESKTVLLNRDISIEYKERVRTFADVNGKIVYPISYEGTTYLPVRAISNLYGAEIGWDGTKNQVSVKRENKIANITSVNVKDINGVLCAEITTDIPLIDYKYFSLEEPYRLILDLVNTNFVIGKEERNIDYKDIQKVRFGVQDNNTSRIVLDLKNIDSYTVIQSEDRLTTYLALSSTFEVPTVGGEQAIVVEKPTQEESGETPENMSGDPVENPIEDKKELTEEEIANLTKITAVTYSSTTKKTRVKLTGSYDYETFMLTDPYRFVIDIKGTKLENDGPDEITPKNNIVTGIRFSQKEIDIVRVVFELKSDAESTVVEKKGYIEFSFEKKISTDNVKYEASDDCATLRLVGVKKRVFSTSEITRTNKYNIAFTSSKFEVAPTIHNIDDEFVESITIKSGSISIKAVAKMSYSMKQDGDDVVLTIKPKEEEDDDGDFVILLDAGHGGADPRRMQWHVI